MPPPLQLVLDPGEGPLYRQVVAALIGDIRRGRLPAGAPLPGTRSLADALGVHRNTVIAAYRELQADGWIDSAIGHGSRVAASLPASPASTTRPRTPSYTLGACDAITSVADAGVAGLLHLGHLPDPREAPRVALARAYRRALANEGERVLDYADRRDGTLTFGHPRLRAALAEMLARERGVVASAADVLVTNGSQMAIHLAARALVVPGDVIAVEAWGHRPVFATLRATGAELVGVPVDGEGLDVDALSRLCARRRVRAVYVTPRHQHPTAVVLSPRRRAALLALAARCGLAVIEDDFDGEVVFEGPPVRPLAADDRDGAVVYIGSLSKDLAPGVRVGLAIAPAAMLQRMASWRSAIDRQGDHALHAAIAELIEDGDLRRHARRMHGLYLRRRDALVAALRERLAAVLSFEVPTRGTAIWAAVAPEVDVELWHRRALLAGVSFATGRSLSLDDGPVAHARFGFAGLDPMRLREAVGRLAKALPIAKVVPAKIGEVDPPRIASAP